MRETEKVPVPFFVQEFEWMKRAAFFLLAVSVAAAFASSHAADAVRARVSADLGAASTRVVITLDRDLPHEVRRTPRGLDVVFAGPVAPDPRSKELADAILSAWRLDGDRTLALVTGEGYRRFDVFELRNPTRIVLDLQGERAAPPAPSPVAPSRPSRVIVLDPGHGGAEEGAKGPSGLLEKDVVLDLARRLERVLERSGTDVVLTRDEDRLVPLDERTAIANQNRAALFVSIHLNSAPTRAAFGAETYFLSPDATDDEARTLSALENRAYAGDEGTPAAAPPTDGLEMILWDLAQNRYLEESARLAEEVQREFNLLVGTRDRGIRQAPFTVLMGATMPAILVEVGFVSNPEEEAKLRDDAYRDRIVEALARAIGTFRQGAVAGGER
jgi:N-acetylmuramoyl-L-alanine amidase